MCAVQEDTYRFDERIRGACCPGISMFCVGHAINIDGHKIKRSASCKIAQWQHGPHTGMQRYLASSERARGKQRRMNTHDPTFVGSSEPLTLTGKLGSGSIMQHSSKDARGLVAAATSCPCSKKSGGETEAAVSAGARGECI